MANIMGNQHYNVRCDKKWNGRVSKESKEKAIMIENNSENSMQDLCDKSSNGKEGEDMCQQVTYPKPMRVVI